jgi:glycosyltransferase involved in cell wall biosynthesis
VPAVTVVVPTLNEAPALPRVLVPLRAVATEMDLEIVVSDGGSTDDTLATALGLADHVVVHRGPERQTIGAGRNAGARAGSGRVILFINADVRFPDDIKGLLTDVVSAAGSAGASTCSVRVHPDEATLADRVVLASCDAVFRAWSAVGRGMGRGECQAVRRDVFDAVGGYDETLAAGEDFELFDRIVREGRRRRRDLEGDFGVHIVRDRVIYEDPRRYRRRGYPRVLAAWAMNSLWVSTVGRSFHRTWEPVR